MLEVGEDSAAPFEARPLEPTPSDPVETSIGPEESRISAVETSRGADTSADQSAYDQPHDACPSALAPPDVSDVSLQASGHRSRRGKPLTPPRKLQVADRKFIQEAVFRPSLSTFELGDLTAEDLEERLLEHRQQQQGIYARQQQLQRRLLLGSRGQRRRCQTPEPSALIQRSRESTGHRHQRPRPQTVQAMQGARAYAARQGANAAVQDAEFWSNRVKMLHHEMDKTVGRIENVRRLHGIFEFSKLLNDRTKQALDEQQRVKAEQLEQRRQWNKAVKQASKANKAERVACLQEEKAGIRAQVVMETGNNRRITQSRDAETMSQKMERKEAIKQKKLLGLLKKVHSQAQREEQAHEHFERRIQEAEQTRVAKEAEVTAMIRESALLMQHLKALKGEQIATQDLVKSPILRYG
uniref:Uncharacterized protein n=2 Tax=Eutreptiella gymnastica TaxID=73025 RepID=A0A7S1IIU5_9EUGL|mmetsp:Transcript_21605/g.38799  ORF Transcript_21605/g.38799 Transcript_21605/m.38799 type:complete len:412 (+) Transcript_21605:167-1402(+)